MDPSSVGDIETCFWNKDMTQQRVAGSITKSFAWVLFIACGGQVNGDGSGNNAQAGGTLGQGGLVSTNAGGSTQLGSAGSKSTGGRANTGGAKAAPIGGFANAGGASGSMGIGGIPPIATGGAGTIGLATPNGYYSEGSLGGYIFPVSDPAGSRIYVAQNQLCAYGTLVQIPPIEGGTGPDYGYAWGVILGWNLNQPMLIADGGPGATPADLSAVNSITIGLVGATGLTLRVQLEVRDAAGNSAYYCSPLPNSGATINLSDLRTQCWATTGSIFFDKASMKPTNLAIQLVTDPMVSHPFNFCVTVLSLQ
jgi:hypothetical protein